MKQNVILECQFWYELEEFVISNGEKSGMSVNGNQMPRSYWNLIISIRDISLYLKGIIAHRNWKITPVKEYFGFKGRNNELFLEYLNDLLNFLQNKEGAKETMANKWGIIQSDESINFSD